MVPERESQSNIPWDNLAALESLPEELLDVVMRNVISEFLAHVHLPSKNFLVGQSIPILTTVQG